MKVKVLKSSLDTYWYSDKIGRVFNVENCPGEDYIVQDIEHIDSGLLKSDCIEVPDEWCVKVGNDEDVNRDHPVIKYLNQKYKKEHDGSATYYGVKDNDSTFTSTGSGPFGKLLTLEEFELIFLDKKPEDMKQENKKLIGYKLNGTVTAQQVADLIQCSPDIYKNGCFLLYPIHFDGGSICSVKGAGNKLKELGVLDLWFTPVYEEETKTITSGSERIEVKITPGISIEAQGKTIKIELLKEIYEDMVDNVFHENNTGWGIKFPSVKIGCSTFSAQEISQIISIYNGE